MLSECLKLDFDDYYNCENRLVKMLSETQKLEFVYDYMGRRREKKVFNKVDDQWQLTTHKSFIYNRYKLIKEVDELASKTMQFVWLGDNLLALEANGTAYNYLADGNKNITQLINLTDGTITNKYDYTPFGKLINEVESVENPFKFSSEYNEIETGLVYYNYRYYNPKDGKWLNRDPIQEKGGFNIYEFVGNNSISNNDSLGLKKKCCSKKEINKIAAKYALKGYNRSKKRMQKWKRKFEKLGYYATVRGIPETCGVICCNKKGKLTATGPSTTHYDSEKSKNGAVGSNYKFEVGIKTVYIGLKIKKACNPNHPQLQCPKGTKRVAAYHSHSYSHSFSDSDIIFAQNSNQPFYLGVDGVVNKLTPSKELVQVTPTRQYSITFFTQESIDPKTGKETRTRKRFTRDTFKGVQ